MPHPDPGGHAAAAAIFHAMEIVAAWAAVVAALGSIWAVFAVDKRAERRELESRRLSDQRAREADDRAAARSLEAEDRAAAREAAREERDSIAGVRRHNGALGEFIKRGELAASVLDAERQRMSGIGPAQTKLGYPEVPNSLGPLHEELLKLNVPDTFDAATKVAIADLITLTETDLFGVFASNPAGWVSIVNARYDDLRQRVETVRKAAWAYPADRR